MKRETFIRMKSVDTITNTKVDVTVLVTVLRNEIGLTLF